MVQKLDWVACAVGGSHDSAIVRVKLPEGFKVDELPAAVKIETCFGNYSSSFEVTNGLLIFTRNVSMRATAAGRLEADANRSWFSRNAGRVL